MAFLVYRLQATEDAVKDQALALLCFGLISGTFPTIGFCVYGYVKKAKEQRDAAIRELDEYHEAGSQLAASILQSCLYQTGGNHNRIVWAYQCFKALGPKLSRVGISQYEVEVVVCKQMGLRYDGGELLTGATEAQREDKAIGLKAREKVVGCLLESGAVTFSQNSPETILVLTDRGRRMLRSAGVDV